MGRRQVFLSYSRRDFAFAEALAAVFEQQGGIDPWLDVRRLDPGTDWSAEIDAAIDDADVLVLVASRTALESPYVTAEWQRARAAGTEIHVCVVGSVELPDELAGCTVHDLRSGFWKRARTVADLLASGSAESAAPPRSSALLPGPVLALIGTCLVATAVVASLLWDAAQPGTVRRLSPLSVGVSLSLAATALISLVLAIRVPWRRAGASALSYNLGFTGLLGYVLLNDSITDSHLFSLSSGAQVGYGALLVLIGLAGGLLMTRSRSVYLWMPTGQGYYQVRQRILGLPVRKRRRRRVVNPKFAYQWAPFAEELRALAGSPATFELRHDPGDEKIARALTSACTEAGLVERPGPDSWVLRVVSSKTDHAKLSREVPALGVRAVCVLADSLALPEDSAELRQRQWLDFRQQTPEGLYNLLRLVLGAGRDGMDSAPVPLATTVSQVPFTAHGFAVATRTHLVGVGAFSLGLVAAVPTLPVLAVGLVSLVPMALLWWLLHATVARTATGRQVVGVSWLLAASVLVWTACLAGLHPGLAVCGLLELLMIATSLVRPLRQLPVHWLPETKVPNRAPLVRPAVLTSYLVPVAALLFGLAAQIPSFFLGSSF